MAIPPGARQTCPLCGGPMRVRQGLVWRWVMCNGQDCDFMMELGDFARTHPE